MILPSLKEISEMRKFFKANLFKSLIAQFTTAFDVELEVDEELLLEFNKGRLC